MVPPDPLLAARLAERTVEHNPREMFHGADEFFDEMWDVAYAAACEKCTPGHDLFGPCSETIVTTVEPTDATQALFDAIATGSSRAVTTALATHKVSPNTRNAEGELAVFAALSRGKADVAAVLLEHGAAGDGRSLLGHTVIHYCVAMARTLRRDVHNGNRLRSALHRILAVLPTSTLDFSELPFDPNDIERFLVEASRNEDFAQSVRVLAIRHPLIELNDGHIETLASFACAAKNLHTLEVESTTFTCPGVVMLVNTISQHAGDHLYKLRLCVASMRPPCSELDRVAFMEIDQHLANFAFSAIIVPVMTVKRSATPHSGEKTSPVCGQ